MEGEKGQQNANDPGQYDGHLKQFASGLQNVNFGDKYKFVPKEGPPPGLYNPDEANGQTKPKIRTAVIDKNTSKLGDFMEGGKGQQNANDPGQYDGHLKPFASGLQNVDFGDKYKFVPKEGPPPGLYNPDEANG